MLKISRIVRISLLGIVLSATPTFASTILWGLDTEDNRLFTLDTGSGVATQIGAALPGFAFGGLDFSGSSLYGLLDNNLYLIDPNTAAANLIGAAAGRTFESFEIIGGVGYAEDVFNESLYSINLATGAATLIGSSSQTANDERITGLAESGGSLYGTRIFQEDLVRLDLATGSVSAVIGVHGLDDSTSLAFADGVFWTFPVGSGSIYSLDPVTGVATLRHSGLGGTLQHVTGLTAADAVVPEPASMLLLGTGLVGLVARRRLKVRK